MSRRRAISTARDLIRKATRDAPGTSKVVRAGRRAALEDEGTHSIFAWPFMAAARKLKGKDRVNRALYEKYQRPMKNVDEKLGRLLERELGTKKMFRQVDVLPTRRRIGKGKHPVKIEHETTSATAPITKLTRGVTPLAASLYVAEKLDKTGSDPMAQQGQEELLKEAAAALETAHRREEAAKLAFAMVEKGKVAPFDTYADFEEKIASLMGKNLEVVREALDLDVDLPDFGKVASTGSVPEDATAAFFHRLAADS